MYPVLIAEGLRKVYPGKRGPVVAVDGVDLALRAGEVLAFLGPNGAGKTTTIKMLAGLVVPDAGSVRIEGKDPQKDPAALARVGAVLEGNRNVYWRLSPLENLEYFGVLRGLAAREARARGLELLSRFGLEKKRSALTQELSRGMQQKLAIAVALVHRPRLLLLDEPTLGLDVEAAEHVKARIQALAAEGQAILLTTHRLEVAEALADRVAIIQKGRIVAEDRTEALLARFSGGHYRIETEAELDPPRRARLLALGARIEDGAVVVDGDEGRLWAALDALRPLPLSRVEKSRADLTEVFLRLVREGADA